MENVETAEEKLAKEKDLQAESSDAGQLPIEVLQADSPAIIIGEEFDKSPITIIYMHMDWVNTTTQWNV
ncbi:hypothetical protein J4Q44_G00036500 [Coregonus suidteri]|uniref:Uncharacterized protein n=1 Tax=Coregonus suidteri TaxID=861788 RepID=A0AAN8MDX6_9TELE